MTTDVARTDVSRTGRADAPLLAETLIQRFEADWSRGSPVALETCLPDPGDPAYLATLEELVHIDLEFAWKAAANGGGPRVETYLARFPALDRPEIVTRLLRQECQLRTRQEDAPSREELRRRFPALPAALDGSLAPEPRLPRPFGGYELLSELGRGGMGVVYRARQIAADRCVAVKIVQPEMLDGGGSSGRERFQTEVRAAARVAHDRIVPIYDVGVVDGCPYYTMPLISGGSLADALVDGPVAGRRAAQWLEETARAVDEAHRHGILHRDLKPQNVLRDETTDRVFVTDFGIARFRTEDTRLTRTGECLGTPAYMAPEQADGRFAETADVYSLGATLYHLLTGQPPIVGPTVLETLRRVREEEPVAPRRLVPTIERDLETICLKCLAKEPARRYASARLLADDLARFLSGEPILARPVGWGERWWRRCRRRPWLSAAVSAIVLLVLFAGLATWQAGAARQQSQADLLTATELNSLLADIGRRELADQPGLQPLRRELLERAVRTFERLLAARSGQPALRAELADAWFQKGRVTELLGDLDESLRAFRTAERLQAELVAEQSVEGSADWATTWNALGRLHLRQGALDGAEAAFRRARELRAAEVAAAPSAPAARWLANTLMNLAEVAKARQQFAAALMLHAEAQTARRRLLEQRPDTEVQGELAMGYYNMATLAGLADDLATARAHAIEAAEQFAALCAARPQDLTLQFRRALSQRLLGDMQENLEPAREHYSQAAAVLEPLAVGSPDVVEYTRELANVFLNQGQCEAEFGEVAAAESSFRQARDWSERGLRRHPGHRELRHVRDAAQRGSDAARAVP